MGRINKTLQGAYTFIVGSYVERSSVEQFINRMTEAGITGQNSLANPDQPDQTSEYSLANLLQEYQIKVRNSLGGALELAAMETIMMQLKAREEMNDVTIYFNKKLYVYARMAFYRNDRDIKEIRLCIGAITEYLENGTATPENLEALNNNPSFMAIVDMKLKLAIDKEIRKSINDYEILKNNLEYSK